MTLDLDALQRCRYSGDRDLLAALQNDKAISSSLLDQAALRHQGTIRMQMLANAVRVEGSVIPHLSNSTRELQERVGLEQPLEAYVFQEAT